MSITHLPYGQQRFSGMPCNTAYNLSDALRRNDPIFIDQLETGLKNGEFEGLGLDLYKNLKRFEPNQLEALKLLVSSTVPVELDSLDYLLQNASHSILLSEAFNRLFVENFEKSASSINLINFSLSKDQPIDKIIQVFGHNFPINLTTCFLLNHPSFTNKGWFLQATVQELVKNAHPAISELYHKSADQIVSTNFESLIGVEGCDWSTLITGAILKGLPRAVIDGLGFRAGGQIDWFASYLLANMSAS